jgi:hypothetical protein
MLLIFHALQGSTLYGMTCDISHIALNNRRITITRMTEDFTLS